MAMTGDFLAVFTSDKEGPRWKAWFAMSEEEQRTTAERGVAAVEAWDEAHRDVIVYQGGPLGATKRVVDGQIADHVNHLTVFMVVRAGSHDEAAALLANHPHCTIFPCDGVEVMPILKADD